MDIRDKEKMVQLAKEGKKISTIWREDFPQYDYGIDDLDSVNNAYYEVLGTDIFSKDLFGKEIPCFLSCDAFQIFENRWPRIAIA